MRLIDADALVRELEAGYCDDECDRNLDCVHGRDCPIYDEVTHIYEADTVEAVPIKPLARWLAGHVNQVGWIKPSRIIENPDKSYFELATDEWTEFLRGMDWGVDDADD